MTHEGNFYDNAVAVFAFVCLYLCVSKVAWSIVLFLPFSEYYCFRLALLHEASMAHRSLLAYCYLAFIYEVIGKDRYHS